MGGLPLPDASEETEQNSALYDTVCTPYVTEHSNHVINTLHGHTVGFEWNERESYKQQRPTATTIIPATPDWAPLVVACT